MLSTEVTRSSIIHEMFLKLYPLLQSTFCVKSLVKERLKLLDHGAASALRSMRDEIYKLLEEKQEGAMLWIDVALSANLDSYIPEDERLRLKNHLNNKVSNKTKTCVRNQHWEFSVDVTHGSSHVQPQPTLPLESPYSPLVPKTTL